MFWTVPLSLFRQMILLFGKPHISEEVGFPFGA